MARFRVYGNTNFEIEVEAIDDEEACDLVDRYIDIVRIKSAPDRLGELEYTSTSTSADEIEEEEPVDRDSTNEEDA